MRIDEKAWSKFTSAFDKNPEGWEVYGVLGLPPHERSVYKVFVRDAEAREKKWWMFGEGGPEHVGSSFPDVGYARMPERTVRGPIALLLGLDHQEDYEDLHRLVAFLRERAPAS